MNRTEGKMKLDELKRLLFEAYEIDNLPAIEALETLIREAEEQEAAA